MVITPLSASITAPATLSTKKITSESRSVYSLSNATPAIVSGNEITDATRTANTQGDGRTVTNIILNGNAQTNTNNTGVFGDFAVTRDLAVQNPYGQTSFKFTNAAGAFTQPIIGWFDTGGLPASTTLTFGVDIWIPSNWDGGTIFISLSNGTGTGFVDISTVNPDMSKKDQWQRITKTITTGTNPTTNFCNIRCSNATTAGRSIWMTGAQVELGTVANKYVPTNGAISAPVGEDSSYGIWESTTNLITNGGFEANVTGWGPANASLSRITSDFKFGAASGQVVTNGTNANEGISLNINLSALTTYTYSLWIKAPLNSTLRMMVQERAVGSVIQTDISGTITATGAWQRVVLTFTTVATVDNAYFWIQTASSIQGITFKVDGVQVEQRAYATPYVETNGGTASRSAGDVQIPVGSMNTTQGWVAMRLRPAFAAASPPASFTLPFWWSTGGSDIALGFTGTKFYAESKDAGVGSLVQSAAQSFTGSNTVSAIASWNSSNVLISALGAAFLSASRSTIPFIQSKMAHLMTTGGGSNPFNGDVLWMAMGTGTLTNADAATINGWGDTDPTWAQLVALNGGAANPTLLWTANNQAIITSLTAATTKVTSESRSISVPATVSRNSIGSFSRSAVATAILNRQSSSGMARRIVATPTPFVAKQTALLRSVSAPTVPSVNKVTPFIRSVIAASTLSVVKQTGLVRGLTATPSLSNGKLTILVRSIVVPVAASGGRLHSFFSSISVPVTLSVSKVTGMRRSVIKSAVLSFVQLILGKTHARGTATDFSGHTMTTGDLPGHTLTATDGGE